MKRFTVLRIVGIALMVGTTALAHAADPDWQTNSQK